LQRIKHFLVLFFVGLFLSFFIKQPYLQYCAVSPESIMEVNVARNLAAGKGFTLSIKDAYYIDGPVIHSAIGERGIILPFLLKPFINKTNHLQWINLIISFITAILFFYMARLAFDEKIAWFSFITFIFFPRINVAASYLWNSTLLLFFMVLAGLIFLAVRKWWGELITGTLVGLAFWAEPWAIFFILALLPGILLSGKSIKEGAQKAAVIFAGFLLPAIPMLLWIQDVNGSPVPPGIPAYFQVKDYSAYIWESYNYPMPGIFGFIAANTQWILHSIWKNILKYGRFFIHRQCSPVLILGLSGLIFAGKKAFREFPRRFIPMPVFSVLYFLGTCMVWSYADFNKASLFSLIFLIPVAYYFLCRIEIRKFPLGLVLASLILVFSLNNYISVNYMELRYELHNYNLSRQLNIKDEQLFIIKESTNEDEKIAAIYPWLVNLQSRRPCGILPTNLTKGQLREFIIKFGYNYIADNERGARGENLRKMIERENIPWLYEMIYGFWRVQFD